MVQPELSSRPPVILLGVDHEWAARSLDSILAPGGYAVLRAHSPRFTLELARSSRPDAIIIESFVGPDDGLDICRELRADPMIGASTPIIVLASDGAARAERLAALTAGAWLFCAQPLDAESLLIQLRTFVDAKRACDQYRVDNVLDEMTGLYSLQGLARRAREMGAEAQRRHAALTCIVFTPVEPSAAAAANASAEAHGSLARHIATVLRRCGRISDAIGRLGPLEFAIIAPDTSTAGARALIERLVSVFASSAILADSPWPSIRIQAGFHTAANLADSPVDAVEILLRATTTLRYVRSRSDGISVQSFEEVPEAIL